MKQQQLTFEKGISTSPSDVICSDNTLSQSLGIIFRDGEHHLIQEPKEILDTDDKGFNSSYPPKLLFVHHHHDGSKSYIYYDTYTTSGHSPGIYWNEYDTTNKRLLPKSAIAATNEDPTVTAIGNILIIRDEKHINMWLWKNSSYKLLGSKLKEPDVEFRLKSLATDLDLVSETLNAVELFDFEWDDTATALKIKNVKKGKQEVYNNLVLGLYAKNKNTIAHDKRFCEPFFACVAVELYDGSYIFQSAPQLLYPSVRYNSYAEYWEDEVTMRTAFLRLNIKADFDYTDYSDIIKDVVVFVTDGVNIYDTTTDQTPRASYSGTTSNKKEYHDGVFYTSANGGSTYKSEEVPFASQSPDLINYRITFLPLNENSDSDILEQIKSNGIFYKLCSLGIKRDGQKTVNSTPVDNWINAEEIIKPNVLENLTVQERLPIDYFSHCELSASVVKSYNGRLHLGGVRRGFAPVPTMLLNYAPTTSNTNSYDIYVEIETADGTKIVKGGISSTKMLMGMYFYYPDPRAKKVTFKNTSGAANSFLTLDLVEHPSLNGAYYLKKLPATGDSDTFVSGSTPTVSDDPELLHSQLYVSSVNNPFHFPPEGNITVGTGDVLSLATLTTALSQGQFGQYPLLVFTTQGIWAASIGTDGNYMSTRPMSREVCTYPSTVTETDGAIFFASEKGLMRIVGSDVQCVSRQLDGGWWKYVGTSEKIVSFDKWLDGAKIAYDYRDSLLWLICDGNDPLTYSMRSGTFASVSNSHGTFLGVVNDYPDTLVQYENKIYSFSSRDDMLSQTGLSASMRSRPMKLENALALKTIMEARHIMSFKASEVVDVVNEEIVDGETVQTPGTETVVHLSWEVWATNNFLDEWVQLTSLRGKPWKYYQFRYTFSALKGGDTFAGTVIVTEERRTNKLR